MAPERNTALLERPLTARSLIASMLLGMRPPRLSGARLVRWCGLFGVAEGTARVALSRMVERGELLTDQGVYELAGRMRERQPAQDWSLAPETATWDGGWRIAAVGHGPRDASDRVALRDAMRRLRYAEDREGVWTRPANLPRASAPPDAWAVADAQCDWWTARPDERAIDLATRLFAPVDWADRARGLSERLDDVTRALGTDEVYLAEGFIAGAAALAHVRADPLLPAALCPRRWPGPLLRDRYRAFQDVFAVTVRAWFRSA